MFCHKCGAKINEGSVFCHECGTKVVYEQVADTESNGKTNTRLSLGKPAKIISLISVAVIMLVLVKSGILKNALDTLSDINREVESQITGGTIVQDMQSAADIFSLDGSEETAGNEFPDYGYDDGTMGYDGLAEDYGGQYQDLDPSLIGRWRSYDGGMLEFSDVGTITSCDFQCWSLKRQKPDLIYWVTSNGRVTCTAFFDNDVEYRIWTQFEGTEDEREMINVGGGNNDYYRVSGTYGGGIVGKWSNAWGGLWSYQFNEDSTGMWNDMYAISWYTYTRDDGTSALKYTIVDSTYFDYTITGDVLTVFLSDSSRIYTKVGK